MCKIVRRYAQLVAMERHRTPVERQTQNVVLDVLDFSDLIRGVLRQTINDDHAFDMLVKCKFNDHADPGVLTFHFYRGGQVDVYSSSDLHRAFLHAYAAVLPPLQLMPSAINVHLAFIDTLAKSTLRVLQRTSRYAIELKQGSFRFPGSSLRIASLKNYVFSPVAHTPSLRSDQLLPCDREVFLLMYESEPRAIRFNGYLKVFVSPHAPAADHAFRRVNIHFKGKDVTKLLRKGARQQLLLPVMPTDWRAAFADCVRKLQALRSLPLCRIERVVVHWHRRRAHITVLIPVANIPKEAFEQLYPYVVCNAVADVVQRVLPHGSCMTLIEATPVGLLFRFRSLPWIGSLSDELATPGPVVAALGGRPQRHTGTTAPDVLRVPYVLSSNDLARVCLGTRAITLWYDSASSGALERITLRDPFDAAAAIGAEFTNAADFALCDANWKALFLEDNDEYVYFDEHAFNYEFSRRSVARILTDMLNDKGTRTVTIQPDRTVLLRFGTFALDADVPLQFHWSSDAAQVEVKDIMPISREQLLMSLETEATLGLRVNDSVTIHVDEENYVIAQMKLPTAWPAEQRAAAHAAFDAFQVCARGALPRGVTVYPVESTLSSKWEVLRFDIDLNELETNENARVLLLAHCFPAPVKLQIQVAQSLFVLRRLDWTGVALDRNRL